MKFDHGHGRSKFLWTKRSKAASGRPKTAWRQNDPKQMTVQKEACFVNRQPPRCGPLPIDKKGPEFPPALAKRPWALQIALQK
jgi:hypothetical protein